MPQPSNRSCKYTTDEVSKFDIYMETSNSNILKIYININVTGRNEHVPAIEQTICTMGELIRAIVNQLPFKAYPHRLIVEMVYNVTFWLNCFPHRDGLHGTMSPQTRITSLNIDHNKHC